ncbi:MAG TPA: SCO family protein [Allosphingosinicella sp.]
MNGLEKSRAPWPFLLALFVLLAACSQPAETPPLEGAALGGAFTLVDQDGKTVTEKDYAGRYRIVYFGYTYCPDVCPVDLQMLMKGFAAFEQAEPDKAAKVQHIFITVDPERDTPAVMKQYVRAFHPRLIGFSGTADQVKAAAKTFGVYYQRRDVEGASEYLMDHSRNAVLFDPDGKPIALLPQDQGADAVAAELKRWVR